MKALWIALIAALPTGDVTVVIQRSAARAKRGQVSSTLLTELSHLAKDEGISSACLKFSGDKLSLHGIPATLHQRFRNTWSANYK